METVIENDVFYCICIQLKFHLNMTKLWSWKQKLKMQQFTMNLLCQIRTNLRRSREIEKEIMKRPCIIRNRLYGYFV